MRVNILYDNLSEDEAYKLEHETILDYVFNKGYGIDIIGYNNKNEEPGHLTNHTFGGDGSKGMVHSEEWCAKHSEQMKGENNPAYGINYWEIKTPDEIAVLKEKYRAAAIGENNPMFGIPPKERMSEDKYQQWLVKTKDRLCKQTGKANPNAKKINVYNENKEFLFSMDTITDVCLWLKEKYNLSTKIPGMISYISKMIKLGKSYYGYYYQLAD